MYRKFEVATKTPRFFFVALCLRGEKVAEGLIYRDFVPLSYMNNLCSQLTDTA